MKRLAREFLVDILFTSAILVVLVLLYAVIRGS